jgi:hypothetical protein
MSNLIAQDRSNIYTNLLNPFLYNPSLSNSSDNIYTCFNARGFVGGIDGSQRSYNFAIYSPLTNGTGIGAKVLTSADNTFSMSANSPGIYYIKVFGTERIFKIVKL